MRIPTLILAFILSTASFGDCEKPIQKDKPITQAIDELHRFTVNSNGYFVGRRPNGKKCIVHIDGAGTDAAIGWLIHVWNGETQKASASKNYGFGLFRPSLSTVVGMSEEYAAKNFRIDQVQESNARSKLTVIATRLHGDDIRHRSLSMKVEMTRNTDGQVITVFVRDHRGNARCKDLRPSENY